MGGRKSCTRRKGGKGSVEDKEAKEYEKEDIIVEDKEKIEEM